MIVYQMWAVHRICKIAYDSGMNIKSTVRKVVPKSTVKHLEETFRKQRSGVMHAAYLKPARKLRVIAVTGTNGKTSTCNYINDILKAAGKKTAMNTTAVIEIAGERRLNTSHRTVPHVRQLMSFLREAKRKQVDFVILETTSHALHQHKVLNIPIEVAVITNLTQDHLDYHITMESYAQAKARLFNSYTNPKVSILNRDDEYYEYFAFQAKGDVLTYGQNQDSSYRLSKIQSSGQGSNFLLASRDGKTSVNIPQSGVFSAYNATAAIAATVAVGVEFKAAVNAAKNLQYIPGRLERVEISTPYQVYVDYAHTPDALKNVLETMKPKTGKLWLVFGATGDRDKEKRPDMGAIAAKYADKIVLTDEETYSENGDTIREMLSEGINRGGGKEKTTEIPDRREAIKYAMAHAQKNDVILLTGIGHQNSRVMAGTTLPWVESEVVQDILKEF